MQYLSYIDGTNCSRLLAVGLTAKIELTILDNIVILNNSLLVYYIIPCLYNVRKCSISDLVHAPGSQHVTETGCLAS